MTNYNLNGTWICSCKVVHGQCKVVGMIRAAVGLFGALIVAFCWWHDQPSLRAELLQCISDKRHRALIYVALNILHLSWAMMIFCAGWASLNQHRVGYEHYLHHALTEYIEQRNGWFVGLTPPGIPSATPTESCTNTAKLLDDRKVCGFLEFLKRVVPKTGRIWNVGHDAFDGRAPDPQPRIWQKAQAIHAGHFFYNDGECLFAWQGISSSKRGRSGEVIHAYKAVTAEHVGQWKDTLATMERGDLVPWPTFVDFIHLHRISASHCTCGTFQVMGVCEEILLWLILKEPQFQVLLM